MYSPRFPFAALGWAFLLVGPGAFAQAPTSDESYKSAGLAPPGEIHGRVTDAEGRPLEGIRIYSESVQATSDAQGNYSLVDLPAIYNYPLYAAGNALYAPEAYKEIPCFDEWSCFQGYMLAPRSSVITGIDFTLDKGGSVRGTVRDRDTGEPLEDVLVRLNGPTGLHGRSTRTNEQGTYGFGSLAARDDYKVYIGSTESHRSEVWNDVPCRFTTCNFISEGDPISVGIGQVVDGIDFVLDRGASLSGRLTEAGSGAPIPFAYLSLVSTEPIRGSAGTRSDLDGSFSFDRLDPGSYFLKAESRGYVEERWPDSPCTLGSSCASTPAQPITVDLDRPVTDIAFALSPGGTFEGTLFDESVLQVPRNSRIQIYDDSGDLLVTYIVLDGSFSYREIPPGTYYAVAYDDNGAYRPRPWNGADCDSLESCDPLTGDPIVVREGETVELDFSLQKQPFTCSSNTLQLCLQNGRFAVRVDRFDGDDGSVSEAAFPLPLPGISDTGSFWFFDEDNVEILVKVLDGCSADGSAGSFWVFAGGLTDVAAQITVTDSWTGEQTAYLNPQGVPFPPIQDTEAFQTCAAVDPLERAPAELSAKALPVVPPFPRQVSMAPSSKQSPCVPDPTTLCLGLDGRFRVTARWSTGDERGAAGVTPLTGDTGLLWFFNNQNIEVIVKVLDACDSFERHWVFAAGLTDVEVEFAVTDTLTGEQQVYQNPMGNRFEPVQDTEALGGCP